MPLSSKSILVLYGGWSRERDVSLVSGQAAYDALAKRYDRVSLFDVRRDSMTDLLARLSTPVMRPDVIFNALHGRGGEDGVMQGLAELCQIPMTGSGVLSSAMAMHKPTANAVMRQAGIRVPEGRSVTRQDVLDKGWPLSPPFVLKPADDGSSVGVHIIMDDSASPRVDDEGVWEENNELLVEAYVPGRELTVTVLDDGRAPARALAITEICMKTSGDHAFYDYTVKYTEGLATHVLPAPLPEAITHHCLETAVRAFQAVHCQGMARVDLRWDEAKGIEGIVVLEINTQPGLTPLSLSPEQAAYVGLSFEDLMVWLIEACG